MQRLTQPISPSSTTILSIKTLLRQNLYPQALKSSTTHPHHLNPHITDTTYALFIKSGSLLDPFLSASLITHFSHLGDFGRASNFLLDTHRPDTVVFNSLISGYARHALPGPAFGLFNNLTTLGLKPDAYTVSSLISGCEDLPQNEITHGVSIKLGFVSSVFLASGLIENYSKLGSIYGAEKCFEECLVLDSVVWTSMVNGYVWNGEFDMARERFKEMRGLGLEVNGFSLTSVISALFDVTEGEQVHGLGLKMGLLCGSTSSTHFNNALMHLYSRCGHKADAVKVFDEMPCPDVVSWTGWIDAALDGTEALELFVVCLSRLEINEYTLSKILSVIDGQKNVLVTGKQIQGFCHKTGYLFESSVCNALITMYGNSGLMGDARRVFDDMNFRDSVSWNSLIAGYSENGLDDQAVATFSRMRGDFSVRPSYYTLASVLEVVSRASSPEPSMQIHSLMIKLRLISDDYMLSCLITAYGKCNGIGEAKLVFSEIVEVDVVHLNAMAGTFAHAGCYVDILNLFQTRWNLSLGVDSATFSIVLRACGILTDLDQGRIIHSLAHKLGIDPNNFIESGVVDFYCKCGSIGDAEKAFMNIDKGNLAAWNAMITGYAQCGCYGEVYDLFSKMRGFGVNPDEITYLGVLSSCCHAGLANEAQYHLSSMFHLHQIIPCLEHYACVIDVLGRVGLLEDAKRTIDDMPILPDARIWQILLSSCNVHRNVDLGKVAARKLLAMQPENDSAYILLSNLYASAGMWDAVGQLRREMKRQIVYKEPGFSWIQARGSTHHFFAGDASHPEGNEVYKMLQGLTKQMLELPDGAQDGKNPLPMDFMW